MRGCSPRTQGESSRAILLQNAFNLGVWATYELLDIHQFQHEYLCIPISRWALFDLQAGKVAGGS
jgi:hypothetical protein